MKIIVFFVFMLCAPCTQAQIVDLYKMPVSKVKNTALRHVVLFKCKAETAPRTIEQIEKAFASLPSRISEIRAFEWGTNNSPEGLNKGFTHSFILTFDSEADRDAYLPHPEHKRFGELITPWLEDVLVVDYWVHPKTP